ncbi:hypothetical protein AB4P95_30170 (plasmid) [Pseudomonas sp. A1437]|uniref:hypothetical protein n=1 Tax=Pseudomonas sp. A1437 TaxID=3235107 RepID=UPI003784144B
MSKVHWIAWSSCDHEGDSESYSACGVGNGNREGDEWDGARFASEVTCKRCLAHLKKRDAAILKSREAIASEHANDQPY